MIRMSVGDFPANRESEGKVKKKGIVTFPKAAKGQRH